MDLGLLNVVASLTRHCTSLTAVSKRHAIDAFTRQRSGLFTVRRTTMDETQLEPGHVAVVDRHVAC